MWPPFSKISQNGIISDLLNKPKALTAAEIKFCRIILYPPK